jgi:hypothetical protein
MMNWTSPTFEEIKMDAEIGSYQEDSDPMPFAQNHLGNRDADGDSAAHAE